MQVYLKNLELMRIRLWRGDADLEERIANVFIHVDTSDMANYWEDFLSMVDALMQNVHAVHICNWDGYLTFGQCLRHFL